uniref:Uncharacterized protein n=1 Tax=Anguilla anguilla TaxID=7936 RepID=A0A0E9XHT8_ANGAN
MVPNYMDGKRALKKSSNFEESVIQCIYKSKLTETQTDSLKSLKMEYKSIGQLSQITALFQMQFCQHT